MVFIFLSTEMVFINFKTLVFFDNEPCKSPASPLQVTCKLLNLRGTCSELAGRLLQVNCKSAASYLQDRLHPAS